MPEKQETIGDDSITKRYGAKSMLAQLFATVAQSFLFLGMGMSVSIPTIVIRDLYIKTDNKFSITSNEASWYGSVMFITYPIGSLLSGCLQGKFGKKRCMFIANIPGIVGWILLYFASSWIFLLVSTSLMGFYMGFGAGATSSYVGEISETKFRGTLGSLGSTALRLGSLLIYIMAYFFDWRTIALLSTLCPVMCLFVVLLIPESPIWLIARGKNGKAEEALCWLRGWVEPKTVKPEFLELVRYNAVSGSRGIKVIINDEGFFSKFSQLKDSSVYKPLKLMVVYFFFSYVSSLYPLRPFVTHVMQKVDLSVNQNESLVILSIITYLGGMMSSTTVHSFGKRRLTLWTLSINTVLMFLFGTYILAVKHNYLKSMPWLVLTILCSIYFIGSCGISSISWMLMIEVFPNKSRGIATGTCSGMAYIILFALVKSYLPIEMTLNLEYTMFLYSCLGVFGLIYFYFHLPETENKTLLEIEEFFASKVKNNETSN